MIKVRQLSFHLPCTKKINRETFELPSFTRHLDALVREIPLEHLGVAPRWRPHKTVIKEAAWLARDEQCTDDPESSHALIVTVTALEGGGQPADWQSTFPHPKVYSCIEALQAQRQQGCSEVSGGIRCSLRRDAQSDDRTEEKEA